MQRDKGGTSRILFVLSYLGQGNHIVSSVHTGDYNSSVYRRKKFYYQRGLLLLYTKCYLLITLGNTFIFNLGIFMNF